MSKVLRKKIRENYFEDNLLILMNLLLLDKCDVVLQVESLWKKKNLSSIFF